TAAAPQTRARPPARRSARWRRRRARGHGRRRSSRSRATARAPRRCGPSIPRSSATPRRRGRCRRSGRAARARPAGRLAGRGASGCAWAPVDTISPVRVASRARAWSNVAVRAASVSACVTLVWLCGCGFDIPPPSYVSATEIAAVRQQVVELSAHDPYRYGPLFTYDDEMPIAEVLPGDVVRLEAVVIDVDGNELPAQDVETLWLQCGVGPCTAYGSFAASVFDYPCSEYTGLTTDDYCRLGTGSAAFEFRVPRL